VRQQISDQRLNVCVRFNRVGPLPRLADVVDVDHVGGTRDDTFRPNQILAVGGLPIALLDGER